MSVLISYNYYAAKQEVHQYGCC